jgi:hypothetical protein
MPVIRLTVEPAEQARMAEQAVLVGMGELV